MKKIKLFIWIILFGFFSILIFDNQAYFNAKHDLQIYLWLTDEIVFSDLDNTFLLLISFAIGLFLSYIFSIIHRIKQNRIIAQLHSSIDHHLTTISNLKSELNSYNQALEKKNESSQTNSNDSAVSLN